MCLSANVDAAALIGVLCVASSNVTKKGEGGKGTAATTVEGTMEHQRPLAPPFVSIGHN